MEMKAIKITHLQGSVTVHTVGTENQPEMNSSLILSFPPTHLNHNYNRIVEPDRLSPTMI